MNIIIKEYKDIKKEEILNLYQSVGWTNYTERPCMLENAYLHSLKILAAYKNEQLVGIIRVVGDGYSIIYIQDIIVLPEFQRKGIGSALLKEILNQYKDVYQKILLTESKPDTIAFYKSLGFIMDSDMGCVAFMHITIN